MERLEQLLTDWTARGEKGYRVVGDVGTQHQSSLSSRKFARIAIFTVVALVLGFTAYSFAPDSIVPLHGEVGRPEQEGGPKPVVSEEWQPIGPPLIDWSFIGEQQKRPKPASSKPPVPEASPSPQAPAPPPPAPEPPVTEETPVPASEEDFYGVAPEETPHVPGPDPVDHESEQEAEAPESSASPTGDPVPEADPKLQLESDFYGAIPEETPHVPGPDPVDHESEQEAEAPEPSADPTGGPVPEADLKPQSEGDFYGATPEETPHVPGPDEHEEWGDPQPADWEEPTPPEWDEPPTDSSDSQSDDEKGEIEKTE